MQNRRLGHTGVYEWEMNGLKGDVLHRCLGKRVSLRPCVKRARREKRLPFPTHPGPDAGSSFRTRQIRRNRVRIPQTKQYVPDGAGRRIF